MRAMGAALGLVVIGAGCHFEGASGAGGPGADAAVDGNPSGCTIHHLELGDVCAGPEQPALSMKGAVYAIDTSSQVILGEGIGQVASCVAADLGGREVCAGWFESIDVQTDVRVSGTRPLVLIATGELKVRPNGALWAGSGDFAGYDVGGPGADPSDCDDAGAGGTGRKSSTLDIYGGGGGGGFGGAGGAGGYGEQLHAVGGGSGAAVGGAVTELRGGCPGGDGGVTPRAGSGGSGGGAVYLVSGESLRIQGTVDAAGEGGGGGGFVVDVEEGGGGGGGSGGMIVFEGPLDFEGSATAGGGGGGQGAERAVTPETGEDGEDGRSDGQPAAGGSASLAAAGLGGAGATPGDAAGTGVAQPTDITAINDSGGGGGGGEGVILIFDGQ